MLLVTVLVGCSGSEQEESDSSNSENELPDMKLEDLNTRSWESDSDGSMLIEIQILAEEFLRENVRSAFRVARASEFVAAVKRRFQANSSLLSVLNLRRFNRVSEELEQRFGQSWEKYESLAQHVRVMMLDQTLSPFCHCLFISVQCCEEKEFETINRKIKRETRPGKVWMESQKEYVCYEYPSAVSMEEAFITVKEFCFPLTFFQVSHYF